MRRLLYLPRGYDDDAGRRWPLVLFLHGLGEQGDDLELVKRHGPPRLIEDGRDLPAIVAAPQLPPGEPGWSAPALVELLDELEASLRVDPARLYVTGISMGGFGTWTLALAQPERFAALVPIAGGLPGRPDVSPLRDVPVWVFHGERDEVVLPRWSREAAAELRACGGSPLLTTYPEAGHGEAWRLAYDSRELWAWLFAQRR